MQFHFLTIQHLLSFAVLQTPALPAKGSLCPQVYLQPFEAAVRAGAQAIMCLGLP